MKAERGYPRYTITPKGEAALLRGHPWVYDAEILNVEGEAENGALVDVLSKKGRYLGTGFYNSRSKITVRLLSANANDRFDEDFWERRVRYALSYRKTVMADPGDFSACRLIFGGALLIDGVFGMRGGIFFNTGVHADEPGVGLILRHDDDFKTVCESGCAGKNHDRSDEESNDFLH